MTPDQSQIATSDDRERDESELADKELTAGAELMHWRQLLASTGYRLLTRQLGNRLETARKTALDPSAPDEESLRAREVHEQLKQLRDYPAQRTAFLEKSLREQGRARSSPAR